MVDFANPGVLGTPAEFRKRYEAPILAGREPGAAASEAELGAARAAELSAIVNDFILRRTNALLSAHLPPKARERQAGWEGVGRQHKGEPPSSRPCQPRSVSKTLKPHTLGHFGRLLQPFTPAKGAVPPLYSVAGGGQGVFGGCATCDCSRAVRHHRPPQAVQPSQAHLRRRAGGVSGGRPSRRPVRRVCGVRCPLPSRLVRPAGRGWGAGRHAGSPRRGRHDASGLGSDGRQVFLRHRPAGGADGRQPDVARPRGHRVQRHPDAGLVCRAMQGAGLALPAPGRVDVGGAAHHLGQTVLRPRPGPICVPAVVQGGRLWPQPGGRQPPHPV